VKSILCGEAGTRHEVSAADTEDDIDAEEEEEVLIVSLTFLLTVEVCGVLNMPLQLLVITASLSGGDI
tara:strand:- start:163 stop:366 length:204 start_codon:yes stop_codon:yes gene_type:complete